MYRLPDVPTAPTAMEEDGAKIDASAKPLPAETARPMPLWGRFVMIGFLGFFVWLLIHQVAQSEDGSPFIRTMEAISLLAIPFLVSLFPLIAALKRVKVYEEFVEGGKEGMAVALRIIPYLVAILVAAGMFRAAGGIDMITTGLRPILDLVGFPPELVPMCLMRPLSGSGTLGMFTDLVEAHGADSVLATMGGAIFGSTETTLYVVAVYFGSVAVRRTRHAVPAGLFADAVGMFASVWICRWLLA